MMGVEYQCARCGSSVSFQSCANCGGEGYEDHDCFDDSCCCLDPGEDVCSWCRGEGGSHVCLSSREWCHTHPMPGREEVKRGEVESFTVPDRKRKRA